MLSQCRQGYSSNKLPKQDMDLTPSSRSNGSHTTDGESGLPFERECSEVFEESAALQESAFSSRRQLLETASEPGAHESTSDEQGEPPDRTSEAIMETNGTGRSQESVCRKSLDFILGKPGGSRSRQRSHVKPSSCPVPSLGLETSEQRVQWRCRRRSNDGSPKVSGCIKASNQKIGSGGGGASSTSSSSSSWEEFPDSGCVSESSRDGFMPLFEHGLENKEPQLPSSFDMLFRSPLHISPLKAALDDLSASASPALGRSHDWKDLSSPSLPRPALKGSFKRPGSPSRSLRMQVLRPSFAGNKKVISFNEPRCTPKVDSMPRSLSAADIDTAMKQADKDPSLIGNFSKKCALPLVEGAAHDLKMITPSTLADLIQGKYRSVVDNYTVIDCRYPFEYLGGHVQGAVNVFEPQDLLVAFLDETCLSSSHTRHVLVFHCEFSSERAPKLARLLRHEDRQLHMDVYPELRHPEVYLLQGGYKAFYELFEDFCEPCGYVPMRHKDYEAHLCVYRGQAKSTAKRRKARRVRPALCSPSGQHKETLE
ncbi:unnamed protein product [Ixodes persulcatus]